MPMLSGVAQGRFRAPPGPLEDSLETRRLAPHLAYWISVLPQLTWYPHSRWIQPIPSTPTLEGCSFHQQNHFLSPSAGLSSRDWASQVKLHCPVLLKAISVQIKERMCCAFSPTSAPDGKHMHFPSITHIAFALQLHAQAFSCKTELP
jgi:hypothetical protein